MALKLSSSFSILFVLVLLVFPHVLARQIVKDQDVDDFVGLNPPEEPSPPECCDGGEKKVANADQIHGENQGGYGVGAGHGGRGGGRS